MLNVKLKPRDAVYWLLILLFWGLFVKNGNGGGLIMGLAVADEWRCEMWQRTKI